jgi:hypothetical protein
MKTHKLNRPEQPPPRKSWSKESAAPTKPEKIDPQTKCACDPFEAVLDAYARDPERWDGLE